MDFKRITPTLALPPQGGGNKSADTPNLAFTSLRQVYIRTLAVSKIYPSPLEGEGMGGGLRAGRREEMPRGLNHNKRLSICEQPA